MALRFRKRETVKDGGYYWHKNYGVTNNYGTIIDEYSGIFDDVSTAGDNHELNILHYEYQGGVYNRDNPGFCIADNLTVDHFRSGTSQRGRHAPTDCPSNSSLAATAIKRASPNKAEVDIPSFLFELRELPDLYKSLRKLPLDKVADLNLRYQFGIAPIVSDLVALLESHKSIQQRLKDLNRAARGEDIKKTIGLGRYSGQYIERNVDLMNRSGSFIRRDVRYNTKLGVKAHVRFRPNHALGLLTEPDMKQLVWRAALGLTIDVHTLWTIMPWSWLIDWVTNLGDLIESTRNIIPVTPYPVAIMKHYVTNVSAEGYDWGFANLSPYEGVSTQKTRYKVTPSLSLSEKVLSANQIGILGSIGLLRGTNFHR